MKTALLFPGQGAQHPGMMLDIAGAYPEAREVFALASELLGRDILAELNTLGKEELSETRNTQPILLTCELAALRVLKNSGLLYEAAAGFSLGEWAAAVAAGSLTERDAIRFIARRADAMQRAVPPGEGAMAYMLGQDDAFVARFCEEIGDVAPANYNMQGNVSVSGTAAGIERFLEKGEAAGCLVGRISVSIPSHCWLMEPAAEELTPLIQSLEMRNPVKKLLMNATGREAETAGEIRDNLTRQLTRPVLFRQTLDRLFSKGYDRFIEVGPGKVLSKIVKKAAKQQKRSVVVMQAGTAENMEARCF